MATPPIRFDIRGFLLPMVRALAITEASFGKDHPDVAIDLNNLAALLQPPTGSARRNR